MLRRPQGLALALAESFDAITLDRMLPGCDGLELLKRLREAGVGGAGADGQRPGRCRRSGHRPARRRRRLPGQAVRARRAGRATGGAAAPPPAGRRSRARCCGSATWSWTWSSARRRRCGRTIELLPMEFKLLEFMMRNAGQTLSRRTDLRGGLGVLLRSRHQPDRRACRQASPQDRLPGHDAAIQDRARRGLRDFDAP